MLFRDSSDLILRSTQPVSLVPSEMRVVECEQICAPGCGQHRPDLCRQSVVRLAPVQISVVVQETLKDPLRVRLWARLLKVT